MSDKKESEKSCATCRHCLHNEGQTPERDCYVDNCRRNNYWQPDPVTAVKTLMDSLDQSPSQNYYTIDRRYFDPRFKALRGTKE